MSSSAETQIPSPVGQPIEQLLALRPRRQALPGFEPIYSDIVDYILRCTHRIWEEKNVGLCRSHYSADCVVHTLAGETRGIDSVIGNTLSTLASYPDRTLIGEDVIWSEDAPGRFHTSHRIVSLMTHQGDDGFGPATGRRACITTIADCVCVENRIVEEWLVRDNLWLIRQLGLDPWAIAQAQASADQAGGGEIHQWRTDEIQRVRARESLTPPAPSDHPASPAIAAFDLAFNSAQLGQAAEAFSVSAEGRWPSGRRWFGRGGWIGAVVQLTSQFESPAFVVDHWAASQLPLGDTAVALRWSLAGRHVRGGVYGPASHRDVLILGISHLRLRQGMVVEDTTIFDDLAVLRQVMGGLGAC